MQKIFTDLFHLWYLQPVSAERDSVMISNHCCLHKHSEIRNLFTGTLSNVSTNVIIKFNAPFLNSRKASIFKLSSSYWNLHQDLALEVVVASWEGMYVGDRMLNNSLQLGTRKRLICLGRKRMQAIKWTCRPIKIVNCSLQPIEYFK